MWRSLARLACIQRPRFHSIKGSIELIFFHRPQYRSCLLEFPLCRLQSFDWLLDSAALNSLYHSRFSRTYASVAAQVAVSTDESEFSGSDEGLESTKGAKEQARFFHKTLEQPDKKRMVAGMPVAKYVTLKKRQIQMETELWEEASKEYEELLNDMCEQKLAPNLPYVKSLFLGWFEPFRNAITAEQELAKKNLRCPHRSYIVQLPADMMAVITMHKLMALLMTGKGEGGSIRVVHAALAVGDAVEQEARIYSLLEKTKTKTKTKKDGPADELNSLENEEENKQQRLKKTISSLIKQRKTHHLKKVVKNQVDVVPWGQEAQAKVGCCLIQLLIGTAYIQPPVDCIGECPPDLRPAFMHKMKNFSDPQQQSRRYGVIESDPLLRKGLEKSARHLVIPYMPMLVPPLKWRGYDKGAYFFLPSFFMRTHGARQQREAIKRAPSERLEPVFEALDTLGSTRWRVNKKVFTVIDRIWSSGGSLGGLADRKDIPLPEKPDTEDEAELRKWKWRVKNIKKENSERHSQRCDIELKLAVARKLMDEDGFFYPHNLDFRGRAYPMHPHLNHLGSDVCRGILEFADGRPLGTTGFQWLKIHLANQFGGGVDKLSFEDRIAFTESHIEDILDSADQPLEGKRWWLTAEDPFQCLATCINLSEAFRSSSPQTIISHVPIHQDGSCNGLQHYAALGRDKLGAASVNLVGGSKPADVYSGIAERVLDIMRRDAEDDPAVNRDVLLAKSLINQVDRKLVKQTVMTSVYGVTYIGARDQIQQRLKERGATDPYLAACYAAKTTLKALEEMFDGARSIMAWLGDCAKEIASENKPVRWTTPLGLPVVQPYRCVSRHLIRTSLQTLALQRESDKVMGVRQRTAFPPNFVHSLDGAHMMMTAVACKRAGLSFAGVHDSYWTHACDIDHMNRILREKFVELYEAPILEKLLQDFQESFPWLEFPPLPERGDFDLKQVLDSPYFFN